jgi:hypothetical protein
LLARLASNSVWAARPICILLSEPQCRRPPRAAAPANIRLGCSCALGQRLLQPSRGTCSRCQAITARACLTPHPRGSCNCLGAEEQRQAVRLQKHDDALGQHLPQMSCVHTYTHKKKAQVWCAEPVSSGHSTGHSMAFLAPFGLVMHSPVCMSSALKSHWRPICTASCICPGGAAHSAAGRDQGLLAEGTPAAGLGQAPAEQAPHAHHSSSLASVRPQVAHRSRVGYLEGRAALFCNPRQQHKQSMQPPACCSRAALVGGSGTGEPRPGRSRAGAGAAPAQRLPCCQPYKAWPQLSRAIGQCYCSMCVAAGHVYCQCPAAKGSHP